MKLAFMQPYFLPYLGYFDLINCSDHWIAFDLAQYVKQRWMNRNRILHPNRGWQFVTVPVKKAPLSTPIAKIQIQNNLDWKTRILNQIDHYKSTAPHFHEVRSLLESSLAPSFTGLAELNMHTLEKFCQFLGIDFDYELVSDLETDDGEVKAPHDSVFSLCKQIGAQEYVNLPGGTAIYDKEQFSKRGLKLTFRNLPPLQYDCPGYQFEPNLSIVDVLMWNRPEAVRAHLEQHQTCTLQSAPEDNA